MPMIRFITQTQSGLKRTENRRQPGHRGRSWTHYRLLGAIFLVLVFLLTACTGQNNDPVADQNQTPETSPIFNIASASGRVLPAERATVSFGMGGKLAWVIDVDSQVETGDVLARLDSAALSAAIDQAQANLQAAEAQLALASRQPPATDIATATGAVTVAEANLQLAEADAQQAADRAELGIEAAQAELDRAQGLLDLAQAELDSLAALLPEDDPQIAAAEAQVTIAEAGLAAAEAALAEAEDTDLLVAAAEAGAQLAQGQLDQAQALLDKLLAGPDEEELAVLNAQVAQAGALLAAAEAALAEATLVAPFAGTVAAVNFRPGETVLPGQPVIMLGDLTTLQVETTDLNEVDAAQIAAGMTATVTFDALPGYVTEGTITRVANMSTPGQAGTSYTLIIQMDSLPDALRWGMTAFVDIALD
jgi:multidrug efflux pump subunit AcrA (membrane-fusion protein)